MTRAIRSSSRAPRRGEPGQRARALARSELFQASLFLGSSLLIVGVFLFTSQLISRLSEEVTTTSRVLARFCAQASFPAVRDSELQRIFSQVISNVDFPIVITDTDTLPRAWRQVGLDPALVPEASIDSLAAGLAISLVIRGRIEHVRARAMALDRQNPPIPMTQPITRRRIGQVHYGDPPVLDRLRWMPYLSVGVIVLLGSLAAWGLSGIRQAERRSIWMGMARETAHQLGTPLSSLMGWIELLRSRTEGAESAGEVAIPRAEFDETLGEMERDVDRLTKVSQRFSRVGSAPDLQRLDLRPVVEEAVQYIRKRLPTAGGDVVIRERYDPVPEVRLSRELLEWAVENLLTNAVSALDRRPGVIDIAVQGRPDGGMVEVIVTDNGRGMSPPEQRRAFEPGYTTKRRGWGLGLALARRVVEEYHGGRLSIRNSAPGEGTTVVISLPT